MNYCRFLGTAALAALLVGAAGCGGQAAQSGSSASAATSESAGATGSTQATPGTTASTAKASASPLPSAVSTPVAAPGKGSITQTVAPSKVASAAPVKVGQPATLQGVAVRVESLRSTTVKATVPGDVSGAAVAVTVQLANTGGKPFDLGQVVVNLTGADGAPGVLLQSAPSKPFSGQLAAGAKASAVYAFRIDKAQQRAVRVTVQPSPTLAVASVTGAAA